MINSIINLIECSIIGIYSMLNINLVLKLERKLGYNFQNKYSVYCALLVSFISSILEMTAKPETITIGTIGMRFFVCIVLCYFYYFCQDKFLDHK